MVKEICTMITFPVWYAPDPDRIWLFFQEVIRSGRRLQNEITSESVASGTASKPEFYRKNLKWSEGLISASKDIGRGAKLLVDSANAVVNEQVWVLSCSLALARNTHSMGSL